MYGGIALLLLLVINAGFYYLLNRQSGSLSRKDIRIAFSSLSLSLGGFAFFLMLYNIFDSIETAPTTFKENKFLSWYVGLVIVVMTISILVFFSARRNKVLPESVRRSEIG